MYTQFELVMSCHINNNMYIFLFGYNNCGILTLKLVNLIYPK